jgi:hypothetical protein
MMSSTAGNKIKSIILQPRDLHLLRELATMRVIDREQAQIVAGFGSTTRVNTRLHALAQNGLLRRFFLGTTDGGRKALYALSRKAAPLVDVLFTGPRLHAGDTLVVDFFIRHQFAINQVYCALKYGPLPPTVTFRQWTTFRRPLAPEIRLIPDGYVELDTSLGIQRAFLEIDLGNERVKLWKEKVRNYLRLALSRKHDGHPGEPFRVIVITSAETQRRMIENAIRAFTQKIFWTTTFEAMNRSGFFGEIWHRPNTHEARPFCELPRT